MKILSIVHRNGIIYYYLTQNGRTTHISFVEAVRTSFDLTQVFYGGDSK
jgi:hypothetical protein